MPVTCRTTPSGSHTARHAPEAPIVLVIAFSESVHTARWLNMSAHGPFRYVLCPVFGSGTIQNMMSARPVCRRGELSMLAPGEIAVFDTEAVPSDLVEAVDAAAGFRPFHPSWLPGKMTFTRPGHVVAAIEAFRPAIVHSMETQFSGYLALAARRYLADAFPLWLHSNWGSDVYLYRKLPDHHATLMALAGSVDAYLAECRRDVALLRQLGFRGKVLPNVPASGGMRLSDLPDLATLVPPSHRSEILIKGYHGWSGRGLNILAAVHMAAPALKRFEIRINLAGPEMAATAEALRDIDGLDVECLPYVESHAEMMERLARARMVIGLGISDGISTTLLEAMAVGAFPVQGNTSCGDEWIVPGRTGFLVPHYDVRALADAISVAARDDALVDAAAPVNRRTIEERWNMERNGARIAAELSALLADPPVRMRVPEA